ncbi:RNA-directed DNA polymerase, eukaryota [Tanacetum coccineum]
MSSQRSKEDHVILLSKSIFVANFPENFGSSDLWKVCESYGKVVDVYIPNRKSKAGKQFAFVRFIRVVDIDRLVGNLCTIWIGRFHLHANVVRFERASKPVKPTGFTHTNVHGNFGSYVTTVRGKIPLTVPNTPSFSVSALVLDDSCAIVRDLSRHVMGRVKDLNSILNLRFLLTKEGFPKVKLSYLGGLWVMVEMDNVASEGIPLNVWSRKTFVKIGNKWGETMDIEDNFGSSFARVKNKSVGLQHSDEESEDDSDADGVPETVFGENSSSSHVRSGETGKQHSNDPFRIYDLLKKILLDDGFVEVVTDSGAEKETTPLVNAKVMNNSQEVHESSNRESASPNTCNVHNGGSILEVLEDMVRVGHSMGYNMEGCMKDIERIIGSQGVDDVLK